MDERIIKYLEVASALKVKQELCDIVYDDAARLKRQRDRIRDDLKSILSDSVPRRAYRVGNQVVVVVWRGTDLPVITIIELEE